MPERDARAWAVVAEHAPDACQRLGQAVALAPGVVDANLVELARLRIAQLLRCAVTGSRGAPEGSGTALDPAKVDSVAQWPTSPLFSSTERAALALTEQFVIDVGGVTDEQTAALLGALGPAGLQGFVQALYVTDMTMRLEMSLDLVFTDSKEQP